MNREILFRGRTDTGDWIYGDLDHTPDGGKSEYGIKPFAEATILVLPETVGQYTGLADKNGVKIFEGDIVLFKTISYKKGKKEIVRYENGLLCPFYDPTYTEDELGDWFDSEFGFEVIGNSTDNPEILEGK